MSPEGGVQYPFDASNEDLLQNIDQHVATTISSLQSYYLVMPRSEGFTEYPAFERAYSVLFAKTRGFSDFTVASITAAVVEDPLVLVVLRCILGFSPSELAYLAAAESGLTITQGFARTLDQQARAGKPLLSRSSADVRGRVEAILHAAWKTIVAGIPKPQKGALHRLAKIDTDGGLPTLQRVAQAGVPYSMLLYERFLGRPFASHRDAVSEQVGDILEEAITQQLLKHGTPFHKTGRAERIPGFDQAPDFLIPTRESPIAVIEAKLTEDDGTARDKVTRVQHLRQLADQGAEFEVIAAIDGRGFSVRREDMKKLLLATNGKVFTMATMDRLIGATRLSRFRSPA